MVGTKPGMEKKDVGEGVGGDGDNFWIFPKAKAERRGRKGHTCINPAEPIVEPHCQSQFSIKFTPANLARDIHGSGSGLQMLAI